MTEKTQSKSGSEEQVVFKENPYDVETIFESLSVASDHDMELLYMDRLINSLRINPECDVTHISYLILKDLKAI